MIYSMKFYEIQDSNFYYVLIRIYELLELTAYVGEMFLEKLIVFASS